MRNSFDISKVIEDFDSENTTQACGEFTRLKSPNQQQPVNTKSCRAVRLNLGNVYEIVDKTFPFPGIVQPQKYVVLIVNISVLTSYSFNEQLEQVNTE